MRKIAEERFRLLRTTGRVDIPQSMAYFVFMLLISVLLTVLGAGFIWMAFTESDGWTGVFSHPAAWIGLMLVLFFGPFGIPSLIIQMRWRAVLTLTWDGMSEHRLKKGERVTTSTTAWRDISGFSGRHISGRWYVKWQYTVFMHLRPDAHDRFRAGLSRGMGRLQSVNEAILGTGTIALRHYAGGPKALHELLDRAHREFGATPHDRFWR